MYPVFLVETEIPKAEKFYFLELEEDTYYKLYFIKVENEEEIKLHLCNIALYPFSIYFVIKENKKIFQKSKSVSFYYENSVMDLSWVGAEIMSVESGMSGPTDIVKPIDSREDINIDHEIRIYNQKEKNKIKNDKFKYLNAKDKKDSYIKELDQNHFNDGTYLYIENNKNYLKCINKVLKWEIEVEWSEELLNIMYYNVGFEEKTYEKFKV